jgi:hypothetical protein
MDGTGNRAVSLAEMKRPKSPILKDIQDLLAGDPDGIDFDVVH